jgi:DNA repair exonuclease SbcCD ATPase subunit
LGEEARAASQENSGTGTPAWSLALSGLMVLSGAASVALSGGLTRFAIAGICIAAAAAAPWLGGRMAKAALRERRSRLLASLKDQWALGAGAVVSASAAPASGGSPAADLSTLESFLAAMQTAARERDALDAREKDALRRVEEQQDALAKLDAAIRDLKDGEEAAHRRERDWLARHGVADFAEYLHKSSRSRQVREDAAKRRAELEALAQGTDWNSFRRDLRRKLQDLDEAGVADKGLDEAALQRQRQRRKELQKIQEDLGREEGGLIAQKERLAGEISGAMGKLAPEIVAWEDRLAEAEKDVKAKELDKQAAAMVRDIFKEIGDGADLMLQGLSEDIQEMLGAILPKGRSVSLLGLEDRQIQVQDALGGIRSLDHLSTGTRHAMVLAAKLALARKHRKGPGILVLDEPFLAMDGERVRRALELLRDFHARNGWQIILLTKEPGLVEMVRTLFPVPRVLDLSLPDL